MSFLACLCFIEFPPIHTTGTRIPDGFFSLLLEEVTSPRKREFRTPFFLIWSLPLLWYGSLSGSISLSHLSIFYNISCYNSLVLLTFVSRSSCRFTLKKKTRPEFECLGRDQMRKKGVRNSLFRGDVTSSNNNESAIFRR
jgi:hypothetical protein